MLSVKLNDDRELPILGLGTWKLQGQTCLDIVRAALDSGYRHIDTAYRYNNHEMIAKAIDRSDVNREDVYLTTKIWRDELEPAALKQQFIQILTELNTDYVDLLLVHWPNREIPIAQTYQAMKELQDQGMAVSLGVSNFTIAHLKEAMDVGFTPAVNQVEFHPSLYQKELWDFCKQHSIQLEAYSPLAQGEDIDHEIVQSIADKYGVTPAQITIAWLINKGIIAIPRSSKVEHVKENLVALDIVMSSEHINALDGLGEGNRLIEPPFAEFDT